jgi:hypothetical protein
MGVNWSKLKGRDKWHERIAGRRVHSNLAHNVRELADTDRLQAGGTGLSIGPEHQGRCRTHGHDPTGLGRWAWTRIQGTSDYNTSLFSAYIPCASSNPSVNTVYVQHTHHLSTTSEEPRTQFLLDLAEAIRTRQAAGDIIIVGADLNQDVRHRRIHQFFQELQMYNAILTHHAHLSPPATCHKNDSRVPVDSIWCSIGIHPVVAGFLKYGDATPSDHRLTWVDFAITDIIGHRSAPFRPHVSGLRASDLRDIGRYNHCSFALLEEAKLLPSLTALAQIPKGEFGQASKTEYDRLYLVNQETRLKVRASLRHIYRGQQQWSPAWKQTLQRKQLWTRVVAYRKRHRTGKQVSLTQIRRLMKATNTMDALNHDENESVSRLKQAHSAHASSLKHDRQLREAYLTTQDEAKAEANGTTLEAEQKRRRTTESQREQGRKPAAVKQTRKEPVIKLISTVNGIASTWEEKDDLERVSIQENQSRFSQREGPPECDEKRDISAVGHCYSS